MPKRRRRGEGSLFQRKDGRWVAVTPHPERRAFYGKSMAEAQKKRAAHLRKHPVGARGTVGGFLARWLATVKPTLRPRTYDGYVSTLAHAEALGAIPLNLLTSTDVQEQVNALDSPGLKRQLVGRLKQAFEWGVDTEQLSRNPVRSVVVPPKPKSGARPYSPEETKAWLAAIRGHRYEALFRLMTVEGLRRGEAAALYWRHVGEDGVTVIQGLQRIDGELCVTPVKTSSGNRTLPLSHRTAEALRRWRTEQKALRLKAGKLWHDTEFVFTTRIGTPLEPRNINRMLAAVAKKAKLPARRVHDHRHTALTNLLSRGVDIKTVQAVAGHASLQSTQIYLHVVPGAAERARAAMDEGD